eukprot:gene6160-6000_t
MSDIEDDSDGTRTALERATATHPAPDNDLRIQEVRCVLDAEGETTSQLLARIKAIQREREATGWQPTRSQSSCAPSPSCTQPPNGAPMGPAAPDMDMDPGGHPGTTGRPGPPEEFLEFFPEWRSQGQATT